VQERSFCRDQDNGRSLRHPQGPNSRGRNAGGRCHEDFFRGASGHSCSKSPSTNLVHGPRTPILESGSRLPTSAGLEISGGATGGKIDDEVAVPFAARSRHSLAGEEANPWRGDDRGESGVRPRFDALVLAMLRRGRTPECNQYGPPCREGAVDRPAPHRSSRHPHSSRHAGEAQLGEELWTVIGRAWRRQRVNRL